MTKLLEWLGVFGAFFAIWLSLTTNTLQIKLFDQYAQFILWSPLIFLILFGLYALTVVLYRVITFNNCEEASIELQKEILEAKNELTRLGFKFKQAK